MADRNRATPRRMAAGIVLYRPEHATLAPLLDALMRAGLPVFIYVNGPVSAEIEDRLAQLDGASIARSPENIGLGIGLNAVAEAAAGAGFTHILLLDQDSTPGDRLPAALLRHYEAVAAAGRVEPAVIGPVLVPPEAESYRPIWYSRRESAEAAGAVDFLPTSGSLVALAAWRDIGPFRADYFVDGIDLEWCFRAWSRGYACLLAEEVRMEHRWGQEDVENSRKPQILRQSAVRNYYYLRNSAYMLRLPHVPLRWKTKSALRLLAQSALYLASMRDGMAAGGLVAAALADGWRGRLGPIPADRVIPTGPGR